MLNVDNQKWSVPVLRGSAKPSGRYGQAAAWTRDKMFMFGGVAEDGTLLNVRPRFSVLRHYMPFSVVFVLALCIAVPGDVR